MSSIPGCSIGDREKTLAMPSVGMWGKTHDHRDKREDWAISKYILTVYETTNYPTPRSQQTFFLGSFGHNGIYFLINSPDSAYEI